MKRDLSSGINTLQQPQQIKTLQKFVDSESLQNRRTGGLAQVMFSPVGGSPVGFALTCFEAAVLAGDSPLTIWISDEGVVYPPLLQEKWKISLSRFLLVSARNALEVWKIALEAVQTGLFRWIFIRPSQTCQAIDLRKLQLAAERSSTNVVLLSPLKLPHWYFKLSLRGT